MRFSTTYPLDFAPSFNVFDMKMHDKKNEESLNYWKPCFQSDETFLFSLFFFLFFILHRKILLYDNMKMVKCESWMSVNEKENWNMKDGYVRIYESECIIFSQTFHSWYGAREISFHSSLFYFFDVWRWFRLRIIADFSVSFITIHIY